MIETQHFHSSSVSQYSDTRNTQSLERWKPGKNVQWQGRQLVVLQTKLPVSRRNRALRQAAVRCIQENKQKKNTDTEACMLLCMIVWARDRIRVRQTAVRYTQKKKNMTTCVSVYVCVCGARANQRRTRHHRSSRVCEWCCLNVRACVCWCYFANLSTVSVCLPVHTVTQTHTHTQATLETCNDRKYFICNEGGKHNHTRTHAHTSRYSLHLRHAFENVGLHRRYTLALKIQVTILRGAGACAHERRTGVVAAEGAVSKVHCPWTGLNRQQMLSRCLGLGRQEMLVWHLEVGEPPPEREVLPEQGPGPNVACRLKELQRHREHTNLSCSLKGRWRVLVC